MTAIIYCRVSTLSQEEQGTSLESQESACLALAQSRGFEARVVHDAHTGTELWERPRLTEVREAIKRGEYEALICYSTDRLSRDPIHLAILAGECSRAGCELIFVTEPLEDSPEGWLIRYVKGYAAQIEHAKITERTVRGKRTRLLQGKLLNAGPELYGYRRKDGKRTIYEPEAETVRRIFEWAADGASMREILRRLDDSGALPPRGGRWARSQVQRMLRNPSYIGVSEGWKWKRIKGRISERPVTERISLPDGVTPPIIGKQTWETVQARIGETAAKCAATRNGPRPFLLRGYIYCSECGLRLYPETSRGCRVYRCSSRERASGKCRGSNVRATGVEAWAWRLTRKSIENPTIIALQLEAMRRQEPDDRLAVDIQRLERERDRIERGQRRLLRLLRDSDNPLIESEFHRGESEKRAVDARISELRERQQFELEAQTLLTSLDDYCAQVRREVAGFDFDQQRLALQAFGVTVHASGDVYRLDFDLRGVLAQTC